MWAVSTTGRGTAATVFYFSIDLPTYLQIHGPFLLNLFCSIKSNLKVEYEFPVLHSSVSDVTKGKYILIPTSTTREQYVWVIAPGSPGFSVHRLIILSPIRSSPWEQTLCLS